MSRIVNVLSIDIDYILEPCITLYENHLTQNAPFFVSYKEMLDHPTDMLQHWRELSPLINKVAEISQVNYSEVLEIFTYALFNLKKSDSDKIYFADNHDTIITPIRKMYQQGDRVNIVNLDHHHDIYYNDMQMRNVDLYDLTSPADWVWYLEKNGLVEEYHWISNTNSEDFKPINNQHPVDIKRMSRYSSLAKYDEEASRPKKFDLIYICKSPQWTPQCFYKYFENLKTIAENYFKTTFKQDIGYFCGGRKSIPFFNEEGDATGKKDGVVLNKTFAKEEDGDDI